jgi:hypothetical protein
MEIIYKLVKVGKDEAMAHLKPKLNGYRKKWSQVRIGATAEPELRAERSIIVTGVGPNGAVV